MSGIEKNRVVRKSQRELQIMIDECRIQVSEAEHVIPVHDVFRYCKGYPFENSEFQSVSHEHSEFIIGTGCLSGRRIRLEKYVQPLIFEIVGKCIESEVFLIIYVIADDEIPRMPVPP